MQRIGQVGGAQYDTTHVYVGLNECKFATSFLATFGGRARSRLSYG